MKKSIYLLVAILLVASFALIACGTPSATTTTPSSSTPTNTITSTPTSTTPKPTASTPVITPSPVPSTTVPTGGQQRGGTLRMIFFSGPLTLGDPTLLNDSSSIMGAIPCLEALVISDNSGQIHGVLATDWTLAPDTKSITLNLRKGVKFHDGTDFNAQAAKWNLDRQIAAKTAGATQWESVEIVNDNAIKINLKTYQNTLLYGLEASAGLMVSPTAAQKNGVDWMKTNPIGTGPFKFKSFARDVTLEYIRYEDYWDKGKPYLDGIQFSYIADGTTAQLAFQSGVADVVSTSTDAVTNDLINRGYKLEKRPGPMMNLIPDSKHDNPLANVKVRQAISYAVDRQGMANTLGYGLWEVVNQPAAAFQFGRIDSSPYTYNVTKAKQLMAEAGFPNGFKTSIISSNTFGRDPLLAIQAQLAAIGITVNLNLLEFAAWNNLVTKGWDNGLLYATQGATQTNYTSFLNLYYSATATRYPVLQKPAGLAELIDKALVATDYNTMKSLSQQAVKLIVDDSTAIPLFIQSASYVTTDRVHDCYFSSLAGSGFRWNPQDAWLSK